MHRRLFAAGLPLLLTGQTAPEPAEKPVEFLCPMDADVRQAKPGRCPRCGMKLVAGLPDPLEYPVRVSMTPANAKPGQRVRLHFFLTHPRTGRPVENLELVHERVFHLFLISEDLEHFAHEHPQPAGPGHFVFDWTFDRGGLWRVLCDFYPAGGTPQLVSRSILLPGGSLRRARLAPSASFSAAGKNLTAELRLEPAQPIAGEKTLLFYRLSPREKVEPYLGAWGHMLVASADLVDLIHTHPFLIDGGMATPPTDAKLVQFNVIFPRAGVHRVWAQFERDGIVNTIPFNVPVTAL